MRGLLLPLLLLPIIISAQFTDKKLKPVFTAYSELQPMSSYDSLMLSQLPEFKADENALRRLLPHAVDNSQLPWFRPLVAQVGLECGQASSIGVVFTYEMAFARQVPANVPENQYTTHFTYNFINGGVNSGINFYETFEIIKKAGNPNIADYGGMAPGGPSMWMNGYNKYFNAMHNRASEVYSIKVNTADGIQTLKNWIYDHADGSSAGGVGCFYAEFSYPPSTFPPGTPEAGKHVITIWGNSANHAMSICGYNDSIRWDYNNDGQYTNHIDINGDGMLDVRDWEIGGFKMANTYGSISGWGDQGFAYMMYKSVADQFQQGGIWNNTVVIVEVKEDHQPQLTVKIELSHSCRSKLKVTAGVSSDPQATEPEQVLHFPIFDFQGGCQPMQGNGLPENIEFGLDLNPLLVHIEPGTEARYFLMIEENDPLNNDSGSLMSFSLIDYTQGVNEISSQVNELPLVANAITMVHINASIDYDPVLITTNELPPLQLYGNYSTPLQATGGTPPYKWMIAEDYIQFDSVATMPVITEQILELSDNNSGNAEVILPFEFPYFGKEYNVIYATSDGYLTFENTLLPWPYYVEGKTYFIDNPMIAPSMSHPYYVNSGEGDGVWYEESEDYVTFRWKLSVYQSGGTMNATARLYRDGRIEMNFGEFNVPSYVRRYTGISAGDGENYCLLSHYPDYSPAMDQFIRFTPVMLHPGIQLSPDGVLSGTAVEMSEEIALRFRVTDNNNISNYKTLLLSTEGLQMEYEVIAGDDEVIEFGEDFSLNLHITNHNSFALGVTNFSITTLNPNFSIINNQASIQGLLPGETIILENAFTLRAGNNVPDNLQANFIISASSAEGNWSRSIKLKAHRPVMAIGDLQIIDGNNGILEPGENALFRLTISNNGGAKLMNAVAGLQTWDPYLTITGITQTRDTLKPDESWTISYNLSLAPATPLYHLLLINVNVSGHNQFNFLQTIPLLTGFIVEDFETGDFSSFGWQSGGNTNWITESEKAWEGTYSARSGVIADNQSTALWLDWNVAYVDSVSFWYSVSSEPGYDFLQFYCGDEEMGSWAGNVPWTYARFAVGAGQQKLMWKYIKDYSVSTEEDCARIDYILLPVFAVPTVAGNEETMLSAFSVYPNPFDGDFTVSFSLKESSKVSLFISDANGRVLFRHSYAHPLSEGHYMLQPDVNLSGSGTYLIVLQTDTAKYVKKLIRTQ